MVINFQRLSHLRRLQTWLNIVAVGHSYAGSVITEAAVGSPTSRSFPLTRFNQLTEDFTEGDVRSMTIFKKARGVDKTTCQSDLTAHGKI